MLITMLNFHQVSTRDLQSDYAWRSVEDLRLKKCQLVAIQLHIRHNAQSSLINISVRSVTDLFLTN